MQSFQQIVSHLPVHVIHRNKNYAELKLICVATFPPNFLVSVCSEVMFEGQKHRVKIMMSSPTFRF